MLTHTSFKSGASTVGIARRPPRSPRRMLPQLPPKPQRNSTPVFFSVRFDRLAPSEKRYLRAMAELGPGPHRSGEISTVLSRGVGAVAPTRAKLIEKGMIYSPAHGDTGFTVPLFNEHLKRVLPRIDLYVR